MGELLIIKGTDVSFYIPPTGIEVVAEGDLTSNKERTYRFVRDAVTLERLEYCILLDEDGNKRFVRGPAVVFPKPTEHFLKKKNAKGERTRKFRAIELNPQMGIYVKVIADYDKHKAGDELFITGKDTKIYYPREEHAIIKYANEEIHYAITVPAGEARYVLNKVTGDVELVKGPAMFLPDPRTQVIVRRVLPPKLVELMYPGNQEALNMNIQLGELKSALNLDEHQHVTRGMVTGAAPVGAYASSVMASNLMPDGVTQDDLSWMASDAEDEKIRVQRLLRQRAAKGFAGDDFDRKTEYTPPRTIQLDTKYEGAVRMNIWTGYAVQIVSATGSRRIVAGPANVLLSYDETPEVIELSRGMPKDDKQLKRTVYLRCRNNKVSDMISVETKDRVTVNIAVSYRVNFEGEPEKWFEVENYVKFMTDHCRSMIRNQAKQIGIEAFDADSIAIVRNTILGVTDENGKRTGRVFEENGMRIYDVEVLEVTIGDPSIQTLLRQTQHKSVKQTLEIAEKERSLEIVQRSEALDREAMAVQHETTMVRASLKLETIAKELELRMNELRSRITHDEAERKAELASQDDIETIHTAELIREKNEALQRMEFDQKRLQMAIDDLNARKDAWVAKAGAISPKLVEALQGFTDKDVAARVGEALGPLTLLGGDSAAEILNNVLKGTKLEGVFGKGNGSDGPARLTDGGDAPPATSGPSSKRKPSRQRT
jgi:major vault protein